MKTLIILALTVGALVPFAACSNKTVVREQPAANSPTVVRENNTVIKERQPSPTVIERETRY